MNRRKLVGCLTFVFACSSLICWLVEHLVVPLHSVSSKNIRSSIELSENCQPDLSVESIEGEGNHIVVMNGWSALFLSTEHFWYMHSKVSLNDFQDGIWSQVGVLSVYEELLLSKYVWITLLTLCLVHSSMDILLFKRIARLCSGADETQRSLNEIERARFWLYLEKSFVEKMIVVLFVLTRSQRSTERENMLAAGLLPRQRITTEASIFFIWLATIWSVQAICDQCHARLIQLTKLSLTENLELCYGLLGVQLITIGASGSFLSVAFCSFGLLHPLYAFIMIFQAASIFLHSIHSLVVSGFKIYNQKCPFWINLFTCLKHIFAALDVGMSLVVGCLINGNFVALCLVSKFVNSIADATRILIDTV